MIDLRLEDPQEVQRFLNNAGQDVKREDVNQMQQEKMAAMNYVLGNSAQDDNNQIGDSEVILNFQTEWHSVLIRKMYRNERLTCEP